MARILVVDDSQDILDLARLYLTSFGHEVLTAKSAMDAMEVLNSYRVDLGILDIEMPYTNGFQLAQTLRNSLRYKFFPIIFLTARKEKADVERAMKMKIDGYVLKPIQKEKLQEAIDLVVKKITPAHHNTVEIEKTVISKTAQIITKEPIQLKSISDIGIQVTTQTKLKMDEVVELNTNLFHEIGIPQVSMRVTSVKEHGPNMWELKLVFVGLSYESVQKLRSWILAQDIKNVAS